MGESAGLRAVVLVGGYGTRLRPLTLTRPKQMLPVANRLMIERVADRLAAFEVAEMILALGYRPDAFVAAFPDDTCAGVPLRYVVEDDPLGTAGGLRHAATQAGVDDTFIVLNGDVLTDADLDELVALHRRARAEGTISLAPVDDPYRFGVVPTDDDGRVQAFIEKPPPGEAPTNLINAGTYVLEPAILDRIAPGVDISVEHDTFPKMVAEGRLYALGSDAFWLDTGTPEQYIEANLEYLRRDDPAAVAAIAPSAEVDASAEVTESVLLPDSIVRAGATVERSIVGARAVIGEGATVADLSVIGDEVEIDAGATLVGERVPAGS